jgi:outer membrane protein assembly factor BamB
LIRALATRFVASRFARSGGARSGPKRPCLNGVLARFTLAVLAAAVAAVACASAEPLASTDWTLPNGNRASTRATTASPIDVTSVKRLHRVWAYRFTNSTVHDPDGSPEAIRGVIATPIVAGSTVYIQDSTSSVYAIDRSNGKLRWEHRFRAPNFGRNGLAYSSGSLYGATDTTAFALSSRTGRLIWQRQLITPLEQYVDIAPLIADNLVFVSTVGYPPGGRGALYALDAHSGAIRWRLQTVAAPWRHPDEAGGGGAWYTPSLDSRGRLYWGTANPYPLGGSRALPNGQAYAGAAPYTDSLLAVDEQTGRLLWHDQITSHDVRDYDFQLPPILALDPATDRELVLGGGKGGAVVAWDATTHERVWSATVGRHLNDRGPLPDRRVTVCPGFFGGVETPMALSAGRLFVPVVDLCAYGSAFGYEPISKLDPVDGTGELVALDAATGRVDWRRTFPQPDFGCATVASGVVFTSTFDGHLYALEAKTGTTLWQARTPAGVNGCPSLSGDLLLVPAGSGSTRLRSPRYELVAYSVG